MDGIYRSTEKVTNECTASQRSYEIAGSKFNVTRHFAGNKQLKTIIMEIAVNRANREMSDVKTTT